MVTYRICYWCDRNFESIPSGVIYVEDKIDVAYDRFYETLEKTEAERIEMYDISIDGTFELIDRLTSIN